MPITLTAEDKAKLQDKQIANVLRKLNSGKTLTTHEGAMERDEHEEEVRQAAAVLPSAEMLDKILRYETKQERQMYRAMAQLERVQRMRQGEDIPALLPVEVSDRG